MRTLLKVSIPVEKGNEAFQKGAIESTLKATMESLKPEAAYFYPERGRRACFFVFDMKSESQIPMIVEPLFANLNASVSLTTVMNIDDLQKGLGEIKR
jgi:hypothetical protein